jgi:ABC-2 type transport system permease protein
MNGVWTITCKDLRLLFRDLRAFALLLFLPMGFITVIGMSTGQFLTGGEESRQSRVAVVDLDQSEISASAIRNLKEHEELVVELYPSRETARIALQKGDVAALIVLGDQMEEIVDELNMHDILGGESGGLAGGLDSLDVTLDVGDKVADAGLLRYFLFGELYRTVFPVVARRNPVLRTYLPKEDEAGTETDPPPAETVDAVAATTTAPEKSNPVYRFLVPGFTVMFVFFLINIMARSFIAERDAGTLRRLQLAPLPPVAILVGKTLPFYLTSVLQTSILFLTGRLLFQMPWGPEPIYLVPVILCTSSAATALGLLLATLVRTDQQVSSYGTSLVLILGGLSGCFIPRAWLPEMMKTISLGTPHAWALRAFDGVLTSSSVDPALIFDCCAVLLGFAVAFFAVGWWRFRPAV